MRRRLPVLAVVLGLAAGPGASASASVPGGPAAGLAVRTLASPPATVRPGTSFVLRGRLVNTTRRSAGARLTFSLRPAGGASPLRLTRSRTVRLRARSSLAYAIRVTVPEVAAGRRYAVRACIRRLLFRQAACRTARGRLRVLPTQGTPTTPDVPTSGTPTTPPAGAGTVTAPPAQPGSPAPDPGPTPVAVAGARSAGDSLFPQLGNGGYDATNYDLQLTYTPGTHTLSGTTTMTATATARLRELSLDFQGFTISAIKVDGAAATFTRQDTKLIVTPPAALEPDAPFTVAVTYSGTPPTITDPDGSDEGFIQTPDGAFVVGEPMGSQGWFPNNNHPSDKATFDVTMAVPAALTVVGNGVLVSDETNGLTRTMQWRETHPMATYLATATIGLFSVSDTATVAPLPGDAPIPVYDAVDSALSVSPTAASTLAREQQAVQYFSSLWGRYPFSIVGGIIDNAPTVGYALETQTKPIYPTIPDVSTVAHEISHQWWGDSVTLAQWRDIWLNEGFADYSEKLFDERKDGGPTLKAQFDQNYAKPADDSLWTIPPAAPPTAADIFAPQIYTRGGMTLEALHEIVGESKMNELLTAWFARYRDANATTAQFVALAQQITGKDLGAFFKQWLFTVGKPTITPANF